MTVLLTILLTIFSQGIGNKELSTHHASMVARSYLSGTDITEAIHNTLEDDNISLKPSTSIAAITSNGSSAVGSLARAYCTNESYPGPPITKISLASYPVLPGGIVAALEMSASTETFADDVSSDEKPSACGTISLKVALPDVQRMYSVTTVKPPRSWTSQSHHLSSVIEHPWYKSLFLAQDVLVHSTNTFFHENLDSI